MAAAAVDPIHDILDGHTDMSDLLEIEAQVDDAEQQSRIIQGGFWDLTELQNNKKTPCVCQSTQIMGLKACTHSHLSVACHNLNYSIVRMHT
jgi:hypothetical protein